MVALSKDQVGMGAVGLIDSDMTSAVQNTKKETKGRCE